ncbi:MAG: TetR/AcrR family transcriptional regulator [Sandaracinaceae bacterium]|nr:TetR/AcrR family transcriptional regulator [Sandaracinaceae bacterium]
MVATAERAPSRRERALATRRRVLRAAYALFASGGYAATTMEDIAREAGVAVQTLYFTFRTKGALFGETVGAAIVGFERWDPRAALTGEARAALAAHHSFFPAFEGAPTQSAALVVLVDGTLEVFARVGPLADAMGAAAATDDDVRRIRRMGEQRRAESYRELVARLEARGGLREGLTVRTAADVLFALLSLETWQALRVHRRWSRARARAWLLEAIAQQLLPPEPRRRGPPPARSR